MSSDPGLDLAALRAIRGRRRDHARLLDQIAAFCATHGGGWVAWSGGKDSTVVVHLARQVHPQIPVVFYDCGLDFPDTSTYLAELTSAWDLNLHIIPTDPDLLTLLIATGSFDPAAPTRALGIDVRHTLIGAPAAIAHERFGPGNLWGVRSAESPQRAQLYATQRANGEAGGIVGRVDGSTTYGPIWNWTTNQVFEYCAGAEIPLNPVYATMAALGAPEHLIRVDAMIDPQRLDNGHITYLAQGWPDEFVRLTAVLPRLADYT